MSNQTEKNLIGVISYIPIVGLIVAYILNRDKKDEFVAFHIRQSLGIHIAYLVLVVVAMLPVLGFIIYFLGGLFLLVLWLLGVIYALQGQSKPVPILGEKFNAWFREVA